MEMELLRRNSELLIERFPEFTLKIPSWSFAKALPEELLLPQVQEEDLVYVYGLGGGKPYDQLTDWLHQNKTRRLVFLEDSPSAWMGWLSQKGADSLLQDPKSILCFSQRLRRQILLQSNSLTQG